MLTPRSVLAPILLAIFVTLFGVACSEPTAEEKLASAEETLRAAEDLRDRALDAQERRQTELDAANDALEAAKTRAADAQAKVEELERMIQQLATDDLLFRKVQSALLDDRELAATAISAEVDDGIVTLTGSAPDEETRAHASEVASGILGVREVVSNIRLPPGASAPAPAAEPVPEAEAPGASQ
ncbi:MAG: BON domain-containing protein [Myxococcota bacterium]|nr:BON domain-containing protein [Myxococcota bacterium]